MVLTSYRYEAIYDMGIDMTPVTKFLIASVATLVISGCGGGGEGGSATPRYDYPAAIDKAFANGGYSIQSTGLPNTTYLSAFSVSDFIVDAAGRIVVTGYRNGGTREAWVMRMNANGTPDTSCGSNGWSAFTTGGPATPQRIRELPDGRYVLGGTLGTASVWAIRSTDCGIDTTFGTNGKAGFPYPPQAPLEIQDGVIGMEVDSTGRIVATVASTLSGKLSVARFLSTGVLDSTFGTAGLSQTSAPGGATPKPWALALRNDGRILVAASMQYNSQVGYWAGLIQLQANGQIDTTFGVNGFVSEKPNPNYVAQPKALVILQDGSAIEAGLTQPGVLAGTVAGVDAYFLKVDSTGHKDTSFVDGGLSIWGAAPAGRKDSSNYVTAMIPDGTTGFLNCQNWINVTKVSDKAEPGSPQVLVQRRSNGGQLDAGFHSGGTGWLPRAGDQTATCMALRRTPTGEVLALMDYGQAESAVDETFAIVRVSP
jgi:uncharacterized delta-60 repeat protein